MAEAALAYLAEAAFAIGAAETGAFLTMYSAEIIVAAQVAGTVASVYNMRQQQRAAEQDAKDKYNASLRDRVFQLMQVTAWIDQCTLVGFGTPEERAILLQRRDRDDRRLKRRLRV